MDRRTRLAVYQDHRSTMVSVSPIVAFLKLATADNCANQTSSDPDDQLSSGFSPPSRFSVPSEAENSHETVVEAGAPPRCKARNVFLLLTCAKPFIPDTLNSQNREWRTYRIEKCYQLSSVLSFYKSPWHFTSFPSREETIRLWEQWKNFKVRKLDCLYHAQYEKSIGASLHQGLVEVRA